MDTSVVTKRNLIPLWVLFSALTGEISLAREIQMPKYGKEIIPGVMLLTGHDLKPLQTSFNIPELADPYATMFDDAVVISGTAQHYLKFRSLDDVRRGGPYEIGWNKFHYADGTAMEGGWDLKPALWSSSTQDGPRLWNPKTDKLPPMIVWYGGHRRPNEENYSRDVFAFAQKDSGKWFSMDDSIFSPRRTWPRAKGNFLGHRYGHQMVMVPQIKRDGKPHHVPAVFYEEVTEVRENGAPLVTKIFMDEMATPFQVKAKPVELVGVVNPITGKPYPSAVREDGAALIEGPLYFRFSFKNEEWEAVGFSSGSFYANYPSCFASRKVADGIKGKPYKIDLNDDASDFNNAAAELGKLLNMTGGPGRPAVIVGHNGNAILDEHGMLQVLVHGYRQDILPNPISYSLDQKFRVMIYANLKIRKGPKGVPRFQIVPRPVFAKKRADEIISADLN